MEKLEVDKKTMREIEYFFESYNKLEGKKFKVLGKGGEKKALDRVRKFEKR
jgi:inorganic pyrophosphatase